ncbi:hypothetical protein BH09BAC6_BH09BAC6_23290 [soil metagenome]|jgi:regulator of cell morphogenesis and NO signaling
MEIPEFIDATVFEHRLQHPAILEKFDALEPGFSIVIANDYDMQPLYYELLAARGESFTWKPLESGPMAWQVKITKKSTQPNEETIGEMVSADYRKAMVFKTLGIDFSCAGNRTLREACEDAGLAVDDVLPKLSAELLPSTAPDMDFQKWDTGFLCRYIVQFYHQYIKINTPFIDELAHKVSRANGDKYPEINKVAEIFENAGKSLTANMLKEGETVFPYITKLSDAYRKGIIFNKPLSGPTAATDYKMGVGDEKITEAFRLIRRLTNNYKLPPYVSNSYSILYKLLQEYEDDVLLYLHLKNNILFPAVIKMESERLP